MANKFVGLIKRQLALGDHAQCDADVANEGELDREEQNLLRLARELDRAIAKSRQPRGRR